MNKKAISYGFTSESIGSNRNRNSSDRIMQEGPKKEGHADAAGEGRQEHSPEAEQHRPRPLRQMVNTYL